MSHHCSASAFGYTEPRYPLFSAENEQLLFRRIGVTSYREILDMEYTSPSRRTATSAKKCPTTIT